MEWLGLFSGSERALQKEACKIYREMANSIIGEIPIIWKIGE